MADGSGGGKENGACGILSCRLRLWMVGSFGRRGIAVVKMEINHNPGQKLVFVINEMQ